MLVDSGAGCSLMSHSLYEELHRRNPTVALQPTKRLPYGLSGSKVPGEGCVNVDVEFTGHYLLVQFAVAKQMFFRTV
jgi:hypothetical protein